MHGRAACSMQKAETGKLLDLAKLSTTTVHTYNFMLSTCRQSSLPLWERGSILRVFWSSHDTFDSDTAIMD